MVSRARIAVITTVHPALDGRIFHKEARSLVDGGHQVVLIAPDSEGVSDIVVAAGMTYVPLSAGGDRRDRPRRWGELVRYLWSARRDLDVWHIHDPELLLLCAPLRILIARRTRLVYDVHEDNAASVLSKHWLPVWSRLAVSATTRVTERALARTCHLVIGATPRITELFRAGRTTQVVTVHNFPVATPGLIESPVGLPSRAAGVTRCVYVGGLTSIRGVREMVSAMCFLQHEPVELVLAGPFESLDLQEEVLASAPPAVKYLGSIPWQQVPALLRASDIGLLCLMPEPNYTNSLPTKLFEYYAAGLAVIASNFASWSRFVVDPGVGYQVDPRNPQEIAYTIRSLVADPVRRTEMGQRARKIAEESFTWEHESSVLLSAYESFLNPR